MHSTTIQIRNISLLSEEILHLYFKNEHRSHGGKIAKTIFERAYDRAIVDFDSADVAERVLNKNNHLLEGQHLYVSKLPPRCENRFYIENIPKWVTLNLKWVTFKYYLEVRSQSLIDDILFGKDNESAIVSFQNELFDLQNKLNKRPFIDDNGREMNDLKVHPVVHPDTVLICGTFPYIDHHIYPIEDFLSNFKGKVSPNIRSVFAKEESNMALVIFEDYRAVSFLKDSLTIGDNIFSISPFFDQLGWVPQDRKTNILRECPSSIITEKLSSLQVEFLSKPVGINFVCAEVKKQQWNCFFEVTEEKVLVVISETKAISEKIMKYILGCMASIDIKLDDAMMEYWSEIGSELRHLVHDNDIRQWFCYSQNKSLLTILAAPSEIVIVKQDVERFFSDNAIRNAIKKKDVLKCSGAYSKDSCLPYPLVSASPENEHESMRIVKGEMATRTSFQRSAKGYVSITECQPDGKFIILENSHRSKEESLDEWQLKRNLDGKKEVVFTFPSKYVLKPGKTVKIWARGQGGTHSPPDQLIYEGGDSWGVGQNVQTILYNKSGEERATHIQRPR